MDVDDGVEGRNSRPRAVRDIQRHHVVLPELHVRCQPTRSLHHGRRQVDAADVNATLVQVTSNVPGTATHVARRADVVHARGEPVEQLPVERLVLQLLENASDILVGYEVVARLAVLALVSELRSIRARTLTDRTRAPPCTRHDSPRPSGLISRLNFAGSLRPA